MELSNYIYCRQQDGQELIQVRGAICRECRGVWFEIETTGADDLVEGCSTVDCPNQADIFKP